VLNSTTAESRGCRTCSLQANGESPIAPGNSRFGTSVVCFSGSVVHNGTELRRKKAAFCRNGPQSDTRDDCRDVRPSGQQRWIRERTKMTDMSAQRCGEY
jgi:hypothetical protein